MDDRVKNLRTPAECEIFAKNALERGRPDLAEEAGGRWVQFKAEAHGAESKAEIEALQGIYAYEKVLQHRNGKKVSAAKTWQMVKRHGVIEAVERAVNRKSETQEYTSLAEVGLQEFAFEAIIVRYPNLFSESAVQISKDRMKDWE